MQATLVESGSVPGAYRVVLLAEGPGNPKDRHYYTPEAILAALRRIGRRKRDEALIGHHGLSGLSAHQTPTERYIPGRTPGAPEGRGGPAGDLLGPAPVGARDGAGAPNTLQVCSGLVGSGEG